METFPSKPLQHDKVKDMEMNHTARWHSCCISDSCHPMEKAGNQQEDGLMKHAHFSLLQGEPVCTPGMPQGMSGRENGCKSLCSDKHIAKHCIGRTREAAINLKLHWMLQVMLRLNQVCPKLTSCHRLTVFYMQRN